MFNRPPAHLHIIILKVNEMGRKEFILDSLIVKTKIANTVEIQIKNIQLRIP